MSNGPKFTTAAQAGRYLLDLALTAAVDQLHRELGKPRTCEPESRGTFRAAVAESGTGMSPERPNHFQPARGMNRTKRRAAAMRHFVRQKR